MGNPDDGVQFYYCLADECERRRVAIAERVWYRWFRFRDLPFRSPVPHFAARCSHISRCFKIPPLIRLQRLAYAPSSQHVKLWYCIASTLALLLNGLMRGK
jgi:hypothetical protein